MQEFVKLNKHDDNKCETCRSKYIYYDCFLEHTTNFKDDLMEYEFLYVKESITKTLMKC